MAANFSRTRTSRLVRNKDGLRRGIAAVALTALVAYDMVRTLRPVRETPEPVRATDPAESADEPN